MYFKGGISRIANSTSVKTRHKSLSSSLSSPPPSAETGPEQERPQANRSMTSLPPSDIGHTLSNAFDATALLETADSALERIFTTLQQARGLAQQASETPANSELCVLLNKKCQQQLDTVDGIASTTRFKGAKILHGGLGYAYFRLDLGSGKLLCINLDPGIRRSTMGIITTAVSSRLEHLFGITEVPGSYTTPMIRDLNFFTAPRHASFEVDGSPTGLFRDWRGKPDKAANALQEHLNGQHTTGGYTVTYNNHRFTISQRNGKAPVISATSIRGTEFIGGASHSAPQPLRLNLEVGDFTLQVGELAVAVNSQLAEGTAHANRKTGCLEITAYKVLTLDGKLATSTAGLGFAASSYTPDGNLTSANLLDEAACRETLRRIDAALTTVTSQRITYTRLKQRFHHAISEMQANHQRSRATTHIINATQAAESISHTCTQLPLQAATTIQALANAVPSNVKMLLDQNIQQSPLSFCYLRCEKGKERCP